MLTDGHARDTARVPDRTCRAAGRSGRRVYRVAARCAASIGGQTHCIFDQVSTSAPYVNAGKLRAIAVASGKRSSVLPNVPTMVEAGVRGFHAVTYAGVFLSSATPRDIVSRVQAVVTKVLDQAATRDAFHRLGAEVIKSTPEEATRRITTDLAKWKRLPQQTGIRVD